MLPSTVPSVSASAKLLLSWLNPPPHPITVYASHPPSPTTAQHSLPGGALPPYRGRSFTGRIASASPDAPEPEVRIHLPPASSMGNSFANRSVTGDGANILRCAAAPSGDPKGGKIVYRRRSPSSGTAGHDIKTSMPERAKIFEDREAPGDWRFGCVGIRRFGPGARYPQLWEGVRLMYLCSIGGGCAGGT
jgi:hypothetical protein